ncbi:MAG: hypothetical protein ABIO94_10980 [Opitutaceae bacterium]
MSDFSLPSNYRRIKVVKNFHELLTTSFTGEINALCWQRSLPGDFGEVIAQLGSSEEVVPLADSQLLRLRVSEAGRNAINAVMEDLKRLREQQLSPELNCIQRYPRDEESGAVRTDVYSFHADSAPVAADTWLCTYHGASSEGLRNDEAARRVDIPETHAELLRLYGGEADAGFQEFLRENCYDLHYAPLPHAQPFSFGRCNLWRIALDYPGSPVPPCIHRAPETAPGDPPRLLLIS